MNVKLLLIAETKNIVNAATIKAVLNDLSSKFLTFVRNIKIVPEINTKISKNTK